MAGVNEIIESGEASNMPVRSVSELSGDVKRVIENAFARVRVRGECGRISRPRSGHIYLDLKDENAVLSGIIWRGVADRLELSPEEGMEVIATGRLTSYPGQSRYQLVIEELELAGQGALMALLEKRRIAFAQEGLFAPERKKSIPFLPEVIGVVTSPSGAVIKDILHRLGDRFPRDVLIWPSAVQGKGAELKIAEAIQGFNKLVSDSGIPRPDLIIVARGGGSIEDLWCFNEEAVVRAVAASEIPIISAVGHETDTTLIDFVSDKRAPTPSAAAEMAVPVRAELATTLAALEARRQKGLFRFIQRKKEQLLGASRLLARPERLIEPVQQRLDVASERLPGALHRGLNAKAMKLQKMISSLHPAMIKQRLKSSRRELSQLGNNLSPVIHKNLERAWLHLNSTARLMEGLSYRSTLARGYAVIRSEEGDILSSKKQAAKHPRMEIEFSDARMKVQHGSNEPNKKKRMPRSSKKKSDPPEQGSLF